MPVMKWNEIRKDIGDNYIGYAILWFIPIAIKLSPNLGFNSKFADNLPEIPMLMIACSAVLLAGLLTKYRGNGWI